MKKNLSSIPLLLLDTVIVCIVPYLSLFIRFEGNMESQYYLALLGHLPVIALVRIVIFYRFGLYHRLWRYASIGELIAIAGSVTVSSIITTAYLFFVGAELPRSIHFLSWFFNIAFIGGSRLFVRVMWHIRADANETCSKVLIYGAGDAGASITRELQQRYWGSKHVVGFIDDDSRKLKQSLFGIKVLGSRHDIKRIVGRHQVQEVIITIPSISGAALRDIVNECKELGCTVKMVPGLYETAEKNISVKHLREVALEDLLKREPVQLNMNEITGYLSGKRVLVTGAGGSIGSEICRQVARLSPESLILVGRGENSIYEIDRELRDLYHGLAVEPVIADIRDQERINRIFHEYRPHVIFHAAAHKHVPLMEKEPEEAVKNNIFGTRNVAEAADRTGAEVFVMISTDKAVNPTSIMGATKRVAELTVQSLSKISNTKFTAVRFGNVLGSRGSVIPLFKKQIAAGGPITITDPEMRRYFMTIPEAAQLVLQAGAMTKGGEVFVLDMGDPVKIVDMACDLITLSGLTPYKDIKIEFCGLRPGEKLFEELLTAEEGTSATKHNKIFVANLNPVDQKMLYTELNNLLRAREHGEIINILDKLVPTFHSSRIRSCSDLKAPNSPVMAMKTVELQDVGAARRKTIEATF